MIQQQVVSDPIPPFEPFVDADEAAAFVKINRRTILRMARDEEIPAHSVLAGRQRNTWRFLLSELRHWMLTGEVCSEQFRPCPPKRRVQ